MIDPTKLPPNVLRDVRSFVLDNNRVHGADRTDKGCDLYISLCSPNEVFDMWLCWNGIIGYTETIVEAVTGIQGAKS